MKRRPHVPHLASDGPHPGLAKHKQIFAPFVGSWDLDVKWYADGKIVRHERGEWHFAWVLEGRAIQDVWIVPPLNERTGRDDLYEYGTSIRFYDPDADVWRSTWIGPIQCSLRTFLARRRGNEIVLETARGCDPHLRWIFSDVTDTSFRWQNFSNSGDVWTLDQQFEAVRKDDAET
jgi:hypothetical protein